MSTLKRLYKAPLRIQIEEPIQENKIGNYSQNRPQDHCRTQKLCIYCTQRGHLEHAFYFKKRCLNYSDLGRIKDHLRYDHRAKQYWYSDGDLVWLQTKRKRSLSPKLQYS